MKEKLLFITTYLDDYVRMAYRKLIGKPDHINEQILIANLHHLLYEYFEGELLDYIHYNKVV